MNSTTAEKVSYFNTAACGLVSKTSGKAGIDFYHDLAEQASNRAELWRDSEVTRIRETVAAFLNAPTQNTALIPGFSHGMNGVVLSLKGTEKVLLYEQDYPSLTHPFEVNHFNIKWLPKGDGFSIDIKAIENILSHEHIDIFAISHVQWLTGAGINLQEIIRICHNYHTRIIIDTTQSLGALPVSVKDLQPDVLISSSYKWMNAGFGTGVCYISDDFLKQYPPVFGGVHSFVTDKGAKTRQPSVLDLEPGHKNMAGFLILEAAIEEKNKIGIQKIAAHNLQLCQQFISACPALPVSLVGPPTMVNRSPIVVLKDENDLGDWLQKNKIICTHRNNTLRLSFHFHNTKEEVDALIDCIKKMPQKN